MYTESQSSITPHAGTHVTPPTSRCLSPAAAVQYRGGVYVLSSHPTCLLHSRYLSQVRTIDVQTIRCIASLNYKNHEPHRQQPPLSTNDRLPRKRLGAGNQSILGLVPNQELPATSTGGEPPSPSTIPPPPPSTSLHDSTPPTFPVDNRDQISPPGLAHCHRIASHTGRHLLPLRVPPTWHVAAVVDCLSVVCRVATALSAVRPKPRRRRRQRRRRMLPDSAAAGI